MEARDDAVRRLANPETKDVAEVARLQQEIGTLTIVIGDDKESQSLASICHDEILAFVTEAEKEQEIA